MGDLHHRVSCHTASAVAHPARHMAPGSHGARDAIIVVGTVVHALQIEGTMETMSKTVLCGLILVATVKAVADLRVWGILKRRAP